MLQLALLVASLAFAGDADEFQPTVKVGGIIYSHFVYDLTEGADGYNEFALDRAYVTATGTVTPKLGTKVILDADHVKDTALPDGSTVSVDTKYRVFVKNAYLEWKEKKYGTKARFGVVDTPYGAYWDGFTGLRYIAESFVKTYKVSDTADLGVHLTGTDSNGMIDYGVALLNGEGYGKLENGPGKMGAARLTLDPMAKKGKDKGPSFPITVYGSYNSQGEEDAILTGAGSLGFKNRHLIATGEAVMVKVGDLSAMGYSATLMPRKKDLGALLVRYDHFDPSTDTENDASNGLILGGIHDFAEKISLAVTYEQRGLEGEDPDKGVFLRMQAGY